uniref:M4 family metallopeptidase n=1 Tax=Roseihalotalea indica TaxID=2867963 RepID=A0AA49JGK7_9BACT|nr:M4 family metallopeptidase [Tunicatimonas sp. TK19036]
MKKSLGSLLLFFLLSIGFLSAQTTDPWSVKKQRKDTRQQPSFKYQTRNGSATSSARTQPTPGLLPYGLTVKGGSRQEPPREIKGILPVSAGQSARVATDLPSATSVYLEAVASLMQISVPTEEFTAKQQWKDTRGQEHLRMQQQYRGVAIYGSEIIVHADNNHVVQGINGRYIPTPQLLDTSPSVPAQQAIQQSLTHLEGSKNLNDAQKKLLSYDGPTANLVILPSWEKGEPQLAWQVMVRPNMLDYWELLIDAQQGTLIRKTNLTCTFAPDIYLPEEKAEKAHSLTHPHHPTPLAPARSMAASQGSGQDLNGVNQVLNTWQVGDAFGLIDASKDMFTSNDNTALEDLEGVLITYDALRTPQPESVSIVNSANNVFSDPAAVSAHYNASMAYDFFRQNHQRTAINGQGGNILSIVNYVDDDGEELDNAFWNGTFMVYGNGNLAFTPLAGGLDVGGHEMTHGVISSTANLVYRDESGAINEHIADVFGVLIDADDYQLGEDVVLEDVFLSGAMRDMETPHNGGTSLSDRGWQPDHISEIYTGEEDNGGVHINSGIPNRAFFLFANEVGREKAGEVYYHALTTYLTASSEFTDLRRAVINSANDLFGETEVQAATEAFDAVGITETIGDEDPDDEEEDELPTVAGDNFLLTVNTDPLDGNSLYLFNLTANDFSPISTTSVKRKPTVTDDGSLAFFITEDETIQGIELFEPYNEEIISDESLWANLSISKDGERLAIISNQELPEIWVADLTRGENNFMKFELYNPTTQEDITTGEVQYADAIEWDYSGEYLVYDAFNRVQSLDYGKSIEFWDVGYIHVWDNTTNDFGDGRITKLFTNLPEGTSIGNPSFAKTNRNIICFDLFDATDETYLVIASNLNTGETKVVYENNTIGFPSYSSDDRSMVFNVIDEEGRPAVGQIALNEDKLTASGEIDIPIIEAQWTTWFSQGTRVINSPEKDMLSYEFQLADTTITGSITGNAITLVVADTIDVSRLAASFEHSPGSEVYVGEFRQISGVTSNDFNDDVVYTIIAQDGSTRTYTVTVDLVEVEDPITGIDDEIAGQPLVYPNPFQQELTLKKPLSEGITLSLADVLGRSYPVEIQGNQIIARDSLTPGVYFLKIQTRTVSKTIRLLRK